MAPPNINIRGIRQTIPPGFIIGRPRNASSGPPQLLSLQDLNAIGVATHNTVAAAVAAGAAVGSGAPTGVPKDGSLYFDSTTSPFTGYVGFGGSWNKFGGGGGGGGGNAYEITWTSPTLSNFAQQNFGTSTLATTNSLGGITLSDPGTGGNTNSHRQLLIAVPGSTWTAIGRICRNVPLVNFIGGGLSVRNSTSGKSSLFGASGDDGGILGFVNFANDTTFNNDGPFSGEEKPSDFWIKIQNDGTNINVFYSKNGSTFVLVQSQAIASTFLAAAPTHVGFGINSNNSAGSPPLFTVAFDLQSWTLTSP